MDQRSPLEKMLWNTIGEPLYYCEECLRVVHVSRDGVIRKNCDHDSARVMAPRRSILSGRGYAGLTVGNKARVKFSQLAAKVTGRNV
jgi:hypothetical protein